MAKPHYIYELPEHQEKRLEELFKKLDLDGNGKIDIQDLSEALKDSKFGKQYAEVSYGYSPLTISFYIFKFKIFLFFIVHFILHFLAPFFNFLLLRLKFLRNDMLDPN